MIKFFTHRSSPRTPLVCSILGALFIAIGLSALPAQVYADSDDAAIASLKKGLTLSTTAHKNDPESAPAALGEAAEELEAAEAKLLRELQTRAARMEARAEPAHAEPVGAMQARSESPQAEAEINAPASTTGTTTNNAEIRASIKFPAEDSTERDLTEKSLLAAETAPMLAPAEVPAKVEVASDKISQAIQADQNRLIDAEITPHAIHEESLRGLQDLVTRHTALQAELQGKEKALEVLSGKNKALEEQTTALEQRLASTESALREAREPFDDSGDRD